LKLRIVLDATWSAEGAVNGTIEESRRVVHTFETDNAEKWIGLRRRGRTVNRIKMIKRQMFGRAKFDLPRKRILNPA